MMIRDELLQVMRWHDGVRMDVAKSRMNKQP